MRRASTAELPGEANGDQAAAEIGAEHQRDRELDRHDTLGRKGRDEEDRGDARVDQPGEQRADQEGGDEVAVEIADDGRQALGIRAAARSPRAIIASETRISAMPMRMRPPCRQLPGRPLEEEETADDQQHRHEPATDRRRESGRPATSRDRRPASARGRSISTSAPDAAKPAARTATAVEDWSRTATPAPTPAARSLPLLLSRSMRRSAGSWLRSTPVRTMRTAQSSRATPPAR